MPALTINDANIYFEMHGAGQPLVLIAGYTADHLYWMPILNDLAKHFQVIIFDHRGIGRTVDDGRPLSAELMARDVQELIQILGLIKPHIVGHSMGGTIAQCLAHAAPHTIGKLILMATSVKWRYAMLYGLASLSDMYAANVEFDTIYAAELAWVFGEKFLADANNITSLKQIILENRYPQSIENQRRQYKVLEKFDGREYLKNITAESLVIYGKEDILSLPSESEYLASAIAGAKLLGMPCGHALSLEMPRELVKHMVEFLKVSS
jgi:pimeloyl-ACP methyl ester carboxylesterase